MRYILLAVAGLAILIGGCSHIDRVGYEEAIQPLTERYRNARCFETVYPQKPECNIIAREMRVVYEEHLGGGGNGRGLNFVVITNQ